MAASTDQLHTFAMNAEHNLEQLATGIATVGADDATIKGISQMAKMCHQIASGLAKGGTQPQDQPDPNAAPAQPTTDQAISAHMAQRRAAVAQPPA